MTRAATALIALGTNLPFEGVEGPDLLRRAVSSLEAEGLAVVALSSIWRTPPWPPGSDQPEYHNAVAELEVGGRSPHQLYELLRQVERQFGRERRERWGPRTLDLDILAQGEAVGAFGPILLPHPRMHERAFVLAPLAEIAPAWRHPATGRSAAELLEGQADRGEVRKIAPFRASN